MTHRAFIHDWSVGREVAAETDLRALEAPAVALAGSGKLPVITSGTALVASGRLASEESGYLS